MKTLHLLSLVIFALGAQGLLAQEKTEKSDPPEERPQAEEEQAPKVKAVRREVGKALVAWSQEGWRYLDTEAGPADGWTTLEFDDASWKSGQAPLGYGEDEMKTEISFGEDENDKHPSAFFRAKFRVEDPGASAKYACRVQVDDGAAIYLNGKEVKRINLPEGKADKSTYAAKKVSGRGGDEGAYALVEIKAEDLRKGENVLAVSVHQCDAESSDLVFNLELLAVTEAEWMELEKQSKATDKRLEENRNRLRDRQTDRRIETI